MEIPRKREKLPTREGEEPLPEEKIKAIWENPETGEKKEIVLDINEEIKFYKDFYKRNLNFEIDKLEKKEIKRFWLKDREEIKKDMETYGYDFFLIVPENLPSLEKLNQELIEKMEEPGIGRVNKTNETMDFISGGSFKGVRDTEKSKTRIILTKGNQNILYGKDPFLQATLRKDVMQLTGFTKKEVEERIKNEAPLPIDFKTEIKGRETRIRAEGLSLAEYLIFQKTYFDKTLKHLDEEGETRLLKSVPAPHARYCETVSSTWLPIFRQLSIGADMTASSFYNLGTRFGKSYFLL